MTDVVVQYFDGCPHWTLARDRIKTAAEKSSVTLRFEQIETIEKAAETGFRGSPTILIDGSDPFGEADAPVGLACRTYRTEAGSEGSPSVTQLRAAFGETETRLRRG
ncbi:MAG: thioredoxin family protein [Acidimicrobiia bacterium]|nr:thioredoxin family protein [Acidimicrobiia bacterium]